MKVAFSAAFAWLALGLAASSAHATLSAPTSLSATAQSSSSIALQWQDTNSTERGYLVERSSSSSSGFNQVANLGSGSSSYLDSGLSASQTYYYRIRAYSGNGRKRQYSDYTNVVSGTTLSAPAPSPTPSPTASPTPSPTPSPTSTSAATYGPKGPVGPQSGVACSGVSLAPGASLQTAVNNNATGTTFCLAAGTYARQSVIPKDGQKFIGAYGTILDGQSATARAFDGSASNVVIQNLVVKNYTAPAQDAPVHGDNSHSWIVRNNEITANAGRGLNVGDRMLAQFNFIHHNLQMGVGGGDKGTGIVVDSNEISYNNYTDAYAPGWEAGGAKFWASLNLVVSNNFSHHNHGPGLWTDTNNFGTLYEGNRVEDNQDAGIFHEVSYDAIIRGNWIARNGHANAGWIWGAGIQIAASGGVNGGQIEIYNNVVFSNVANTGAGIALLQQDRSSDLLSFPSSYGPHYVQNVYVHDNTVDMTLGGQTGVVCDGGGATYIGSSTAIFTSMNNRFSNNTYYLGNNPGAYDFAWMNGFRNSTDWKNYGQDTTGRFLSGSYMGP